MFTLAIFIAKASLKVNRIPKQTAENWKTIIVNDVGISIKRLYNDFD